MKPSAVAKLSMQMLENMENQPKNKLSFSESKELKIQNERQEEIREYFETYDEYHTNKRNQYNFIEKVKTSLLKESILHLYENSLPKIDAVNKYAIMNNLVDGFIKEEGAYNLLQNFKRNSAMLSEYALIIEEYTSRFINEAKLKNNFDSIIDIGLKDDFFKDLKLVDSEDVEDTIRTRVTNSIEEFIDNNRKDKRKIKDILQKTKEKIDKTEEEDVQECVNNFAKSKITTIRNKHNMNILEAMIKNVTESTMRNDDLKKIYTENGNLNMDLIVENCTLMYTLLETINTSKIKKINSEYLSSFLNKLKA